jgi:hypothetical protein
VSLFMTGVETAQMEDGLESGDPPPRPEACLRQAMDLRAKAAKTRSREVQAQLLLLAED